MNGPKGYTSPTEPVIHVSIVSLSLRWVRENRYTLPPLGMLDAPYNLSMNPYFLIKVSLTGKYCLFEIFLKTFSSIFRIEYMNRFKKA